MQTDRFNELRKNKLSDIFEEDNIVSVWRNIVRNQLRSLEIKDLYDHYDFNYNIKERADSIRNEILRGEYRISQPLIYRKEKKYGICRHLVAPQPTDALVFQVLVEEISEDILTNQPSKNAFYSRDKHNTPKPHKIDDYEFNWREQWEQLQKKIYNFNEDKELIVVTDLANYYDSIDVQELRKVFTTYSDIDEVIIDLIFRILREISWKPDYMPYSFRGLPTTNIEGIRLLAHSFLFEIDKILKSKTNNCFTRWMDDITFGVNSKEKAIETLSAISDMLKSRGLAINMGKTDIYTADEGYYHFQIEKNKYIDSIEKDIDSVDNPENKKYHEEICEELYQKFKEHFNDEDAKYWDKVAKRYISTHYKLKSTKLIKDVPEIYIEYPELRKYLLIYLENIGYSDEASKEVLNIVKNIDIFDDISLFQLCFLVTQWEIPINEETSTFLEEFENHVFRFSYQRKTPFDFYCLLWIKAKYDHYEDLQNFIIKYKNIWHKDSFLRRQVTAVLSRLLFHNNQKVKEILHNQISSGISNTVTLANQILQFSKLDKLDKLLNPYVFPQNVQRPYPLPKFLVLCSLLNSRDIGKNKDVKDKVKKHIKDPYYLKWLDAQYNIN